MVGMERAGTVGGVDGAEEIAAASWTDFLTYIMRFLTGCILNLAPILGTLGCALVFKKSARCLKRLQ